MGKYFVHGVDKGSGRDVELIVEADTSANAKVKGELRGMVVTQVVDVGASSSRSPTSIGSDAKPWKITAIGGMRIGSGVCNILAGLIFSPLLLPVGLIALGIIEIISGANLLKDEAASPSRMKTVAILEIAGILTLAGWIPLVVGILSLIWLADEQVNRYFATLPPDRNVADSK